MTIALKKMPTKKAGWPKTGALIVFAYAEATLSPTAAELDRATAGAIKRAIEHSRFTGKSGQSLHLAAPYGLQASRVVLLGLGDPAKADALALEAAGGRAWSALNAAGEAEGSLLADAIEGCALSAAEQAARIAYGALLATYRFDKYRTKQKPEEKPSAKKLTVMSDAATAAGKLYAAHEAVAAGVFMTRDLVSEPANIIYPETLAKEAETLSKLGVVVEVLGVKEMAKLGMGALLGVGQGSARESKLVVMQWAGKSGSKSGGKGKGKKKEPTLADPVAFIGKGVTFDTGGISIKPSAGMEDMKWDMGGAGVVIGLMKALAGRKAKVDAVGVVGLVENMPSGTAQRPGDIVTSLSGQTIEVLNTDAEGRLVLADALWYCQDRFKPKAMVDLATLTGAIIIALGHEHAGLFSNNDELADSIAAAAKAVGEPVWRLPLGENYDKDINSDAADMKNIGSGRGAGSITAAQFLQRFVNDVPWAHLDIAGVTWSKKATATVPKGGTGFGVRLLDAMVAEKYEG